MRIGVPKEVKDHEYRVGVTPAGAKALRAAGHEVCVETRAGLKVGFSDEDYQRAGASIVGTAAEAYRAELIVKVKEPQPQEWPLLQENQVIFGYLHLAPAPDLTAALMERKVIAIAYETVSDHQGGLPLLTPMSEIAGRLATQSGALALQMINGGSGTLLGGVPGVKPAHVAILGGGVVGTHAAMMAIGLGADVTVLDVNLHRLRYLDDLFRGRLKTRYSEPEAIREEVSHADLLIGSVLLPGKRAPKLITRDMIAAMREGSAFVDVAIDQGGCAETSRPTTHTAPTYIEEGVVHYCVTNMPAACAHTATLALSHATLSYVQRLAKLGWLEALKSDPGLARGLNVVGDRVTLPQIANDHGFPLATLAEVLK